LRTKHEATAKINATCTNGTYTFTRTESRGFQIFFAIIFGDTYAPANASVTFPIGTLTTPALTITNALSVSHACRFNVYLSDLYGRIHTQKQAILVACRSVFSTTSAQLYPFLTKLACRKQVLQVKGHLKWSHEPTSIFAYCSSLGGPTRIAPPEVRVQSSCRSLSHKRVSIRRPLSRFPRSGISSERV
jgi:hypothetical protein